MPMDIDELLNRSYAYTHDALWEQWERWALLFVCVLIHTFTLGLIPLFSGYRYRIFEGGIEPPGVDSWARLFVDGWKLNIIWIVYFLIPLIIAGLIIAGIVFALASPLFTIPAGAGDPGVIIQRTLVATGLFLIALIPLLIVLFFVLDLLQVIAKVRAARTGILMDAFGLRAILSHIKNIGWGNYIVLMLILWILSIILGIIVGAFAGIPVIGWLIALLIAPAIGIFKARYVTLVYDRGLVPEASVGAS
jgi:hypothetical protein